MKKQNGNKKKWIFGLTMTVVATIVVLACGHSQLQSIGDNSSTTVCSKTNSDGSLPDSNTACQYTTYSPAKNSCITVTNETGYDCSQSTTATEISQQTENGTCDGYGSCTMGIPQGDPTTNSFKMWTLTACGG
jgi:hypothetical protein